MKQQFETERLEEAEPGCVQAPRCLLVFMRGFETGVMHNKVGFFLSHDFFDFPSFFVFFLD